MKKIPINKFFHVIYTQELFTKVCSKYIKDQKIIDKLFAQVVKAYSSSGRHYHDMNHLYNVISMWNAHKHFLHDSDAIFFAAIYHDIVYSPIRKNNEEKSAAYFLKKIAPLLNLHYGIESKIKNAIISTKHTKEVEKYWKCDKDIMYLLDFDLEILGTRHEDTYEWYRKGVRKEYWIYPLKLYKAGRKAVLESFLKREKIYLTPEFQKIEKKARKNLQKEINLYLC